MPGFPSRLCEALEARRLFSGVSISQGTVYVIGNAYVPNSITVGLSPDGLAINASLQYTLPSGLVTNNKSFPLASNVFRLVYIRGGNAADHILIDQTNGLFSIPARIYGYGGDDTIICGNENDYVRGGSGNDLIISGGGNDTLYGDAGNDTLYGGNGSDSIHGGAGNDLIYGGTGYNHLWGDSGNDTIIGGNGGNYFRGGYGNDSLVSGSGRDLLIGDAGNDTLVALGGYDTLRGSSGNNLIIGGSGGDAIVSTGRYDTLHGGTGPDQYFVYYSNATVTNNFDATKGDKWHRIAPTAVPGFWTNVANSLFNPWGL